MAYTSPRTWVAGELLTAALLNAHVRDNLLAIAGTTGHVGARVFHSVAQSIANSTVTALAFNSERYDTDAFHDTSASTSRLTVPSGLDGKYLITGTLQFAANATGSRVVSVRLNGTTTIAQHRGPGFSGDPTDLSIVTVYDLVASNYVELVVSQNSGGALNVVTNANHTPEFTITKV